MKPFLHSPALLALCLFATLGGVRAALVQYSPGNHGAGSEVAWQSAAAGASIPLTLEPLSLDPEHSIGSGTINEFEPLWSSSTVAIWYDLGEPSPSGDYAQVVEGSHIAISTHPDNVIAISPPGGAFAPTDPAPPSFSAIGFNYEKTGGYAIHLYVKTVGGTTPEEVSGFGPFNSGFIGWIAENPEDRIEAVYLVQTSFPGPVVPEFSISNIQVGAVPEPSALLLSLIALPLAFRRGKN